MANLVIKLNNEELYDAIQNAEGTPAAIRRETDRIIRNANAYGASFRTNLMKDRKTGETVGDTQAVYGGNVKKMKRTIVGIVFPTNYAAFKDNHLHNTLLKSI